MSSTDTVMDRTVQDMTAPANDNGDHERFSHYAPKAAIVAATIEGTPVVALCGKVWVPSRDPKRYPVCPDCKAAFEALPAHGGQQ